MTRNWLKAMFKTKLKRVGQKFALHINSTNFIRKLYATFVALQYTALNVFYIDVYCIVYFLSRYGCVANLVMVSIIGVHKVEHP